jgi:hypothetical protein
MKKNDDMKKLHDAIDDVTALIVFTIIWCALWAVAYVVWHLGAWTATLS